VKKQDVLRNITIGLTDGLTIPFALAAGLSGLVSSSFNIAIACVALAVAGAVTMSAGAFLEGKKYNEPSRSSALIGLSYLVGGVIVALPYLFVPVPLSALVYTSVASLIILFIAGYYESAVNGANGWAGAIRVMLTGAVAAFAAFAVAKLFS
jgi:VIT1/CCC1 family predicted Fe2+/Mn2+ transporter